MGWDWLYFGMYSVSNENGKLTFFTVFPIQYIYYEAMYQPEIAAASTCSCKSVHTCTESIDMLILGFVGSQ